MRNLTYRAFVGAACLLAVSCSESTTPPDPEAQVDEALEQLASIDDLTAGASTMLGGVTLPHHAAPGACPFNASNQRFVCANVTVQGITMTRYYQLLNGAGAPQSVFSANVTGIRSVHTRGGTITGNAGEQAFSIEIDDEDELTLTGLQSSTKTLTGESSTSWTSTTSEGSVSYVGTRTTNLVFSEGTAFPTGTITMTNSLVGSESSSTATITYNGTSTVTFTASFNGEESMTCTMNLTAPPGTLPTCS